MREKLITDITKLALDFWTMNLRNGTFESHLRTFIMNYDKAMNYTHCCKSDSEQFPNMTLEQAIEKAKPNMNKIQDVDKHIDSIR